MKRFIVLFLLCPLALQAMDEAAPNAITVPAKTHPAKVVVTFHVFRRWDGTRNWHGTEIPIAEWIYRYTFIPEKNKYKHEKPSQLHYFGNSTNQDKHNGYDFTITHVNANNNRVRLNCSLTKFFSFSEHTQNTDIDEPAGTRKFEDLRVAFPDSDFDNSSFPLGDTSNLYCKATATKEN